MKHPPSGTPVNRRDLALDKKADADMMKRLREMGRCQQRLVTDNGLHFIYCGGYCDLPAVKTAKGLRCKHHR